ncbi:unnamed protein product [Chilo suppressalis]|uniref:LRRCT domain-containing protein n=1 Tax=Chilo suppressalis TaxID=168631 RepID=A0ABN8B5A7_CHISP|nr:unnamed protein product [Chilo suppressalis]
MAKVILIFIIAVVAHGVFSLEDDTVAEVVNSTDVAMQSGICLKCICKDGKVDCSSQGLTTYFSKEEWAALKDFKPTVVDMSDNSFENITVMAELPIEILNLSRCGIESIEFAAFRDLQDMRVLDLSHNKLTSSLSPHVFEGRYSPQLYEPLMSMEVLNLGYNDLHSLNSDLFEHLSQLTVLDLSGNPMTTIDYRTLISISSLSLLKVLRLRSCQLTEVPEKFLHTFRNLERLDLSDNLLAGVPEELEESKNLLYLNLNQNPIRELDVNSEEYPGFPRLRKLKELHMCNMPILKKIGQGALAGLENLEKLHLSFNPQLTYISPKALARPDDIGENYDWPMVKELYMKSNGLSELDSRLLSRWDMLTAIDVSDNPFMCDCSTQWMVDTLVPIVDKVKPNASKAMVCSEPEEMRGFTMRHVHDIKRTMRCVDKYGHRPERDGAMLMGTLIGVLLAVPIMMGVILLWKRGYFAFIGFRGPTEVSRAFYKRAPDNDNFM